MARVRDHHDEEQPHPEVHSEGEAPLARKTIEQWAEELGYLPATRIVETARGARRMKIARANPDAWKFTAAKAHAGWPEGKEVTRAEFEAAVEAAAGITAQ